MTADATTAAPPAAAPKTLCANCGAELLGPHCYSCGQPVKGMVRHLGSILHDVLDTVFNIDSRIFRTILPLFLKPGYLSNEYFAGRRVRYVTPFRLYFFLSVAAFLLIQIGLDASLDMARDMVRLSGAMTEIASAPTASEVVRLRDAELAKLAQQRSEKDVDADKLKQLDSEERQLRKQVDKRLAKLEARANEAAAPKAEAAKADATTPEAATQPDAATKPDAAAKSPAISKPDAAIPPAASAKAPAVAAPELPPEAVEAIRKSGQNPDEVRAAVRDAIAAAHSKHDDSEEMNFEINGVPWDPKTHPIHVGWLPEFVNVKLNAAMGRMKENVARIKQDPKPFILDTFGVLPQVLFVLMPLFALLLKVFFIFKRRLYMEHLIVALHSHSFIFLSMIFITLGLLARGWAHTNATWLEWPLGWALFALWWWLPIYLFLMQKRVYRQGWFFTTVKYCAIGFCYTIMVSLGVAVAAVVSLASGR